MSDRLDEVDLISDAYTLVVSSPGLGRALTKDRHLENSIGEKVEGKLFKALAETGSKEFEGILLSWDAETVTIEMEPVPAKARRKKTGTGRTGAGACSHSCSAERYSRTQIISGYLISGRSCGDGCEYKKSYDWFRKRRRDEHRTERGN